MFQLLIILAFSFAGEVLNRLLPLPVPASIYGIVLLFAALELKWVRVAHIREVCDFLLKVMPLMFLPPAVGLLDVWGLVKDSWVELAMITFASTFVVMAVAGWTAQCIMCRTRRRREEPGDSDGN